MAKNIVKFISVDYLKENTTIENNVDSSTLSPFIKKAQDTYLQQILGSSFYDHLSDAFVASSLTANEENLIRDYIQQMVAEWTLYLVLPHINYKLTNKAVSQQSSEFSEASTVEEIKYLRNSVRDLAEFYSERLTSYLCDNSSLFPEYNNPDSPENLPKNSRSYFSGIYIPNRYYGDDENCTNC